MDAADGRANLVREFTGMKKVIVTGAAGFVGSALCRHLAAQGYEVIGLQRTQADVTDTAALNRFFSQNKPQIVVHLASQASPAAGHLNEYLETNIGGHNHVLEAARQAASVEHLLYASSYGVYGHGNPAPQHESAPIAPPAGLYAASKYANEITTHAWARQSKIACTGIRFFNVYGPGARPNTMPMFFAQKLLAKEEVPLFNAGNLERDFIFIDDVVKALEKLIGKPPAANHTLYNLGSGAAVSTRHFTTQLAQALGCEPLLNLLPTAPNEVLKTCASLTALQSHIDWAPQIPLAEGLEIFAAWIKAMK
jgi:UDP-glucuronate 4-epimerase